MPAMLFRNIVYMGLLKLSGVLIRGRGYGVKAVITHCLKWDNEILAAQSRVLDI